MLLMAGTTMSSSAFVMSTALVFVLLALVGPAGTTTMMSIVWPRSVIRGSTTVMWIDASAPAENVTLRLAADDRLYQDKSIPFLHQGITPVELAIPLQFEGQLTVRLGCKDCPPETLLPVHPLDPIQSLSIRLDKTIHHALDVVSIWMACLDHRGRLVEDVRAQVAVHDPSNAIVQYWNIHQPQHSEGRVVNLLFQLSDAPPIGQWTVRATAGDLTASQTFQLTDKRLGSGLITPHNELSNPPEDNTGALLVEPHFVQLDFSPRTASVVRQGSPFAGELVAGTSERGITVGLDVLDQYGSSLHRQTVHLNRTASAIFTVPALANMTTNITLQGTLQSIDGQPVDSQFVLASRSITTIARTRSPPDNGKAQQCSLQLFSRDGRYRFQEGDTLHLAVFTDCSDGGPKLKTDRINYAVTSRSSGHVISWGQEQSVTTTTTMMKGDNNGQSTGGLAQLDISIPITYEMIPGAIVTVFFKGGGREEYQTDLVSSSLSISVEDNHAGSMVQVIHMKAGLARLNVSLTAGSSHYVFGSWAASPAAASNDGAIQQEDTLPASIETDRFLRLLPSYQQDPTDSRPWELFGHGQLWFVRSLEPSNATWQLLETAIPADRAVKRPELRVLTVGPDGQVRMSGPTAVPLLRWASGVSSAPWSIDFQLPETVREGEEMVVAVTLANELETLSNGIGNCSQAQLQMALTGGAVFVANGKKFLQQPACLGVAGQGRSAVYRVGVQVTAPSQLVTLTAQLKGSVNPAGSACCAPVSGNGTAVINLDVHQELVETVPVSRSTLVLDNKFHHFRSDSYLFCLGESTFVSNTTSFDYEMLPLGTTQGRTIIFQAAARAEMRVALMSGKEQLPDEMTGLPSYHLVLGGEENTNSWISKHMNGLTEIKAKVATPKLLRPDRLQTFWISWDHQKLRKKRSNNKGNKSSSGIPHHQQDHQGKTTRSSLSIGKGSHIGLRTIISIPLEAGNDPQEGSFRFIGFSSGWGVQGFFRVWGTAQGVGQTTRTLALMKPLGSNVTDERAEITIKGGISSSMDSIWLTVSSPSSSASMSLVSALERFYRDRAAGISSGNFKDDTNWSRVLQNILRFRMADGSFAEEDRVSDLRLTALAIHVLSTIKSQSYSDPTLLKSALQWMHGQQNDDGSFSKDPADRRNATSFILSCLSDVQHDDIVLYQLMSAAQRFLERELASTNEVRSVVPMASAALLSNSASWPVWMTRLDSVYEALLDCQGCWSEMTYALAAYSHQNRPERVLEIVRSLVAASWHAVHPLDRLRTMKVWSKYGSMLNDPVRSLNLKLSLQNGDVATAIPREETSSPIPLPDYDDGANVDDNFDSTTTTQGTTTPLEERQKLRLHTPQLNFDVPSLPQDVELSISGVGCAVLQTKVQWKTLEPPQLPSGGSSFSLFASIGRDDHPEDPHHNLTSLLCIKWHGGAVADLRLRLEMFSSYSISSVVDPDDDINGPTELKYRASYGNVTIDIDQVKPNCSRCVQVNAERKGGVVRNVQPGRIEAYDRLRPHELSALWLLHWPSSSPAYPTVSGQQLLSSRPNTTCTP